MRDSSYVFAVGVTETRLGGKRPEKTDLRSAAERAAEAASKIPDPQADPNTPRRVKRKAVSWADDSLLQSVRLFSLVSRFSNTWLDNILNIRFLTLSCALALLGTASASRCPGLMT